jgi:hypothetical protein
MHQPIEIAGTLINPDHEAIYLIFNDGLRFKLRLQHIVKKGTQFALVMSRIAKAPAAPRTKKYKGHSLPS